MRYAPDSSCGKVDLAGIGLRIIDDRRNRLGCKRWVSKDDWGLPGDARNRRDVTDEIEIELAVEGGVDCVRRPDQKECITISGRIHDGLGSDIGTGARSIFDNKWLAKTLR